MQVDPIWVNFGIPDNEQARLQKEAEAGRLALPKGGFEVELRLADGTMYREAGRLNFSDVRIYAEHRHARGARRAAQPERRRAAPGPVRARDPEGRDASRTRSRCRSARCSRARRAASSSTWSTRRAAPQPRPVEAGEWSGDTWIITSGLKAGERVIVDGVMKLGPGAPVQDRRAKPPPSRSRAARNPQRRSRPCSRSFFIDRPIFAAVLSIFIVIAGLAAMRVLPVAQYPEIAPPVVTVQRGLPGRLGAGARADRRRAAREPDQRRREHDLHELDLDLAGRGADPGHLRHRHRRRQGGAQRQQPRQAGRAAPAARGAPPGRDGGEGLLGVPAGARLLLARRPLRRRLHLELRDDERARPAQARAGHHQRADLRRQGLRDAHLGAARPADAAPPRPPPT